MAERRKVLVVEDDALIAMELGERLEDLGYVVLGPAHTLAEAAGVLTTERPDAALLDANLDGVSTVDLAASLAAQGVPVAFCTGYDRVKNVPPSLEGAPVLTKPISDDRLSATLKSLLS